ncbi:MAG: hypothetical protein V3T84_05050 [Phycisphaerales bacterium]
MGRQIRLRIAALVPFGRVHINDSPDALQARTEYTNFGVDGDRKIDLAQLRLVYCVVANNADPSVRTQRKPELLKEFSAWWPEGNVFLHDESQTWSDLGVRSDDLIILLPEPASKETMPLIDLVDQQTTMIDENAEKQVLASAISRGIQAAIGPQVRVRIPAVSGQVFIAMPMNEASRPDLADVHDTLKAVCDDLGLKGIRVDDVQTNARITDTIRNLIDSSEFVIADLSDDRPNVFFEAGYAEGVEKTPIYIAREGTELHFDVKDYPVIFYNNQRALREGLKSRLSNLMDS